MEENKNYNQTNQDNNSNYNPSKSLENNVGEESKEIIKKEIHISNGKIQDFMGYWWNDMSEIP